MYHVVRSPRYGQWLTKAEADAFTATTPAIAREVKHWATSTGASCERKPEAFKCEGTVEQIEELLNTELSVFAHTKTGAKVVRRTGTFPNRTTVVDIRSQAPTGILNIALTYVLAAAATVPEHLVGKVVMVTGLSNLPVPRLGSHRPVEIVRALTDADYSVVPSTLATFYNITKWDGSNTNTQAPVEFQGYPGYVDSDLQSFLKDVGIPSYTIPTTRMIGAYAPAPAAESGLDEQYLGAIGRSNQNWYWTESDWLYEVRA